MKKIHQNFQAAKYDIRTILTPPKTNLSYLEVFFKQFITTIENIRFKIYLSFIWIQTHRIFPSHGGYLLSTLQVPGVGFSVAGLDRAKFGFYWFHFFVYCCHSDIDFAKHYILTNFNPDQFVVKISRLKSFKAIEKYRYDLRKTVETRGGGICYYCCTTHAFPCCCHLESRYTNF